MAVLFASCSKLLLSDIFNIDQRSWDSLCEISIPWLDILSSKHFLGFFLILARLSVHLQTSVLYCSANLFFLPTSEQETAGCHHGKKHKLSVKSLREPSWIPAKLHGRRIQLLSSGVYSSCWDRLHVEFPFKRQNVPSRALSCPLLKEASRK